MTAERVFLICLTADYLGSSLSPGFYRDSASSGNVKRLFINTKDEKGRHVTAAHAEMENLRHADVKPVKLYQLVYSTHNLLHSHSFSFVLRRFHGF